MANVVRAFNHSTNTLNLDESSYLAATTSSGFIKLSTDIGTLNVQNLNSPLTDKLLADVQILKDKVSTLEEELSQRIKLEAMRSDPLASLREQVLLFKIGA